MQRLERLLVEIGEGSGGAVTDGRKGESIGDKSQARAKALTHLIGAHRELNVRAPDPFLLPLPTPPTTDPPASPCAAHRRAEPSATSESGQRVGGLR